MKAHTTTRKNIAPFLLPPTRENMITITPGRTTAKKNLLLCHAILFLHLLDPGNVLRLRVRRAHAFFLLPGVPLRFTWRNAHFWSPRNDEDKGRRRGEEGRIFSSQPLRRRCCGCCRVDAENHIQKSKIPTVLYQMWRSAKESLDVYARIDLECVCVFHSNTN